MPRLLGVDIPNDRPTVIALTYLYGVGPKIARDLCHKAGVDPQGRARDSARTSWPAWPPCWTRTTSSKGNCGVSGTRTSCGCATSAVRGIRHRRGLPVRGQRTRTNARTRKGPKKTVAGKKGVKDLR